MLLDLSKVIDVPGASVSFSTSLDLSDLRFGTCFPVQAPVTASGVVRNTAGVLMTTGSITTHLTGVCDRCAGDFEQDVEYPLEVVLVTELADEDHEDEWTFPLDGNNADMDDMKQEQTLLVYGILACLKGLKEQGCNGPVTEAINKIEKHLNQKAHQ